MRAMNYEALRLSSGCLLPNGIPTDRTFAKDSELSDKTVISSSAFLARLGGGGG